MKSKTIFFQSLWWIVFLIPIVLYFGFIYVYAINIPYVDDHGLKGFMAKFISSQSLFEKLEAIFAQHNEHRIVLTRLMVLFVYLIKNEINYEWLIWIGNSFLLGIIYVFYCFFKLNSINPKFLLPLPYLLFSFLQNENTFWGMASVQNFGIVFLCLSAFLALEKQRYLLTFLLIFLAVFTSGNGFIAFAIILFIVFVKEKNKVVVPFFGGGLLLVTAYFFNYHTPPSTPTPNFSHLFPFIKAFFAFVGSFADISIDSFMSFRLLMSIILGLIIIVIMGLSFFKNFPYNFRTKKIVAPPHWQIFLISTFGFITLTAFLVSWSRIAGYGLPTILTSRYKIYSILGVATIYSWVLIISENNHKKILSNIVFLFSFLLFFFSIWNNINAIDYHYKSLITNSFNWDNKISAEATTNDVRYNYHKPNTVINQFSPAEIANILKVSPFFKFDDVSQNVNEVIVKGKHNFAFNLPQEGYFISLNSAERLYIFPSISKKEGIRKFITKNKMFSPLFESHIPKNELRNGIYQIGLISIKHNVLMCYKSSDSVIIKNSKQQEIKTNW